MGMTNKCLGCDYLQCVDCCDHVVLEDTVCVECGKDLSGELEYMEHPKHEVY